MTGIKIAVVVWMIAAVVSIVVHIRSNDGSEDDLN